MDKKLIKEFKTGDFIENFFLIKEASIKTSSNNKSYLDITLADSSGEINSKLWDCTSEDEALYTENKLVKIRGNITEWQGKPQLKILKIRLATEEDNLNIDDFTMCAPEEPELMYNEVLRYIKRINNNDIRNITMYIINESKDKLLYYPAAKTNHHSMKSGLLYHIVTMLRAADVLSDIYTHLNKNLLFAGVILHDIAKLDEMVANQLGIVTDYSKEGQLLGHIIQGIKKVNQVGERLGADKEVIILLEHMILSHHYEPEFGSPKRPMIPEAELLHYLDIIDSRMFDMSKALEGIECNSFSDRIWVLHNRQIYKSAIND